MPIVSWLIYAGLLFFGSVQVLLARWLVGRMRDLVRRGQRVQARRVGGLYEFSAADGRVGRVEAKMGRGRDEVPVIYDPDDLENATIATWAEMWLAPALLGGSGAMIAAAAIVVGLLHRLGVLTPAG
ncbi:MAG: hypothetical protein H6711_17570 [Myxococcales bacterium]|nr:hypothetical protein [Myxococcales bacterium]